MTLDEKVGQLKESAGLVIPGLTDQKPDELIIQGKVGSVLWLSDVKEINRLQHLAVEKSHLHVPILFGFDVIHGYRTVFPVRLAMASSWDPVGVTDTNEVSVELTNTGSVPGDAVAQIYIHHR
jgi:beta-glucosidase